MGEPTRRQILMGMAAAVPLTLLAAPPASAARRRFFTAHEAEVIVEATARLVPGPLDDPAEAGHPGAREAGVLNYLDTMLSAVDFAPERVHAGGPWSDRHGGKANYMAKFIPLTPPQRIAWTKRLQDWRRQYHDGVRLLDKLAKGDFAKASKSTMDAVLADPKAAEFVDLLFGHTIEGMYANPEYGGNRGLVGWQDIKFPGDSQPRGYTAEEIGRYDGKDPVDKSPIVDDFSAYLDNPPELAEARSAENTHHPKGFSWHAKR